MLVQILGFVGALALLTLGVWIYLRSQAWLLNRLPAVWRDHPDLRDGFSAALRATTVGTLRTGFPRWLFTGFWPGALVVAFVAVLLKVTVWAELIMIVGLALWGTSAEMGRLAHESAALARSLQLPTLTHKRRFAKAVRYASLLMVWSGHFGTAVFAGGVVAQAVR
jgi:hypothetical protein